MRIQMIVKMVKKIILIGGLIITAFALISKDDEVATQGLKVGDVAPGFYGIDQAGKQINLSKVIENGPVVLIFYRGYWCPYCNKHLSQLQDSLKLILDKGASVIAVSPELPEYAEKTISKTGASFSIISDTTHQIMKDYKVDYTVGEGKAFMYKVFGMNIEKTNGDDSNTLPVPSTYIIDINGKIKYVHFNSDYKQRASISEILKKL